MKKFILYITCCILVFSCQRESTDVTSIEDPDINPPEITVDGNIFGTIINENGENESDVLIEFGDLSTMSDENGHFLFENISIFKDGTYLIFSKPGFYISSRKFYAIANQTNLLEVQLLSRTGVEALNTENTTNSSIDASNVDLPAGNYVDFNFDRYEGAINYAIQYLDPLDDDSAFQMPGDLTGLNKDANLQVLSCYGMLNIDLRDDSNQAVYFPQGEKGRIKITVSPSLLSTANPTSSLWYFDSKFGTWIEDGEANLNSDVYEGEISRPGFWMVGDGLPFVDITGSISAENDSYTETKLHLANKNLGFSAAVNKTNDGQISMRIPAQIETELAITHQCNIASQREIIAPHQSSTSLEEITLDMMMDNVSINASIVDCNQNAIPQPLIRLDLKEKQYLLRADENGKIEHSFSNCDDAYINIIAIDDQDFKVSEAVQIEISDNIQVGSIQTCEDVEAGYTFQYEGMNWLEELEETASHSWTITTVLGDDKRIIFSPKIMDPISQTVYYSGSFIFNEGENVADYQAHFKTQGFSVFGTCEVEIKNHGSFNSYRFINLDSQISITDNSLFPNNINEVILNVVYYD